MPEPDLVQLFVAPLVEAGFDYYMISGSVAAIEFGEPRSTLDIDLVLLLQQDAVEEFAELFPAPDYYCPPAEVIASEIARPSRGHFNLIHVNSGLKSDIYPSRNHPLLDWAMANRRKTTISGVPCWLVPPEYLILWKLEFYREGSGDKHLRDIKGVLACSADIIDRDLIRQWVDKLGLATYWQQAEH